MHAIQAVILGIIQGLTEFIPVSSSAHLIIVPWLLHWTDPALTSLSFDVALHLGTLLAVLVFFASDWIRLIRALVQSIVQRRIGGDLDRRMAWMLVIGSIPGGIAGVLLESKIDAWFHQPGVPIRSSAMVLMAAIIAGLGLLLLLADRLARHVRGLDGLAWRDAIAIGLAQALAVFPGVSRSGSTITAGLALGLRRESAAKFSFLLAAPIVAGAGGKSMLDLLQSVRAGSVAGGELVLFPIGAISAGIAGYFSIRFLLRYLQTHSMRLFVYYRWALALLVLVAALTWMRA